MWQFNVLLVRALKLLDYDLSFRNTFLNVSTFYSSAGIKCDLEGLKSGNSNSGKPN